MSYLRTHSRSPQSDSRKAIETMRARFALLGFELHVMPAGDLIATRWGLSKALPNLQAAAAFLREVEGQR